ncbi:phage tail assembly chaperone [uncultured Parasphingorhabdus sp.]|uniref:phage tail assembly chaperone n=1 Tax=uncultured Parasphingorhabdus sp. TaxID=2709694 RepID=UPI002AA6B892|nr:phage tail assembly chaperone [uncultured Parasphingorhabdus sp.]
MVSEACPREGGDPSPVGSTDDLSRDGPRPSPGDNDFSSSIEKLCGTVSAVLGWTPDQFWHATPAELATIFAVFAGRGPGQAPLGTEQLEKLKETFPDG